MTPLHYAAMGGHDQIARLLLDMGARHEADMQGCMPIHLACQRNKSLVIEAFVAFVNARGPYGYTPLMYAAQTHRLACVQKLIQLGAHLNASSVRGKTALMLACKDLWRDNSQVQDSRFVAPNQEGPLVIQLLVEHGADIQAVSEGKTAMDNLQDQIRRGPLIDFMIKMGARSEHFDDLHLTRRAELLALIE